LFSSHCSTQNISFTDSGYIIKPPQPSSILHGAPLFTGYPTLVHAALFCCAEWHMDMCVLCRLIQSISWVANLPSAGID